MTEKEFEKRKVKTIMQRNICYVCDRPMASPQFAHFIANTKNNRIKYGSLVIDDIDNGAMVCCLDCNSRCNIGNNDGKSIKLAFKIYKKLLKKYEEEEC